MKNIKLPKISVLTPIYNTNPNDLCEMIDSVLGQTYTDFEFLILNDSPNNKEIEKIVLDYAKHDKRIKYSKNTKNMGITKSRNKLIDLAKGEYLAVVDHDDISMPNRFELEVDYLDKNPHIGVVGGSLIEFHDNKIIQKLEFPQNDHDIKIFIVNVPYGCAPNHPTCMIRKSVLDKSGVRYDEKWSPCEDHSLFLDLLDHTCFHCLPDVVLKYRWHDDNTSCRLHQYMLDLMPLMIKKAREKHPLYYKEYMFNQLTEKLNNTHTEYTKKIKLFGFLPFLKIKFSHGCKKVYLFNFIIIYKEK